MLDLTDRVVLIAGAAGNLGRAVARAAARCGASLALIDRDEATLAGIAMPGGRVMLLPGVDLADDSATRAAVAAVIEKLGRLDGLVATVGGFHAGPGVAAEGWGPFQQMIELNLRPIVALAAAASPWLTSPGGRIVTVGARPALAAPAGLAAYAAAKSAVIRLTESFAAESADRGITVNCVLPSILDTPQNRAAMPDADPARWVAPEALADIVVFLLSDLSRAITGAAIPVYGRS